MAAEAFINGYGLALSLIVAIGAQNAFVLRQGLLQEHVLPVVLICAVSDAFLISIGIFAFAAAERLVPGLMPLMRWGGAAFLFAYGAYSFLNAWRGGGSLKAEGRPASSLGTVVLSCLALTWLNPHVYLDTVGLIGSVSTGFADARMAFAIGAVSASFSFFFVLGYGARYLQPLFAQPRSWRILDAVIGAVMWLIALDLVGIL